MPGTPNPISFADPREPRAWPPALIDLPESVWELTDQGPTTRVRIAGCTLTFTGLEVETTDGIQSAVNDSTREDLLLELYNPEEPWQTWTGFGSEYALYATPAADQDGPVAVEVDLPRSAWSGFVPEFEERDRKLVSIVVAGHCALHLEARRVTGPDQQFASYPEEAEAVALLAGREGPYPTLRIDSDDYVLVAFPHGD